MKYEYSLTEDIPYQNIIVKVKPFINSGTAID
jgi:hypothetical protein